MDVNAEAEIALSSKWLEKILYQEELAVIVLKEFEIDTYIKGHHVYKDIWTPEIGESLDVQLEPNNPVDKYAVCIRKSGNVVGHLKKGVTGRFAKTIFYFLKSDPYSKARTITLGPRCNLGDGEGLQVPCKLKLVGQKKYIEVLRQELSKLKEI